MSFDASEVSAQSGEPLELYELLVTPSAPIGSVVYRGLEGDPVTLVAPWAWEAHCAGISPSPIATYYASGQVSSFQTIFACSIGETAAYQRQVATLTGFVPGKRYQFALPFRVSPTPDGSTFTGIDLLAIGQGPESGVMGAGVLVGHQTADDDGLISVRLGMLGFEFGFTAWVFTVGRLVVMALPIADGGTDDRPSLAPTAYRYTSADVDVVYNGHTYLGGKASRFRRLQPFRPGLAERSRSEVEVAIPRDHLVAALVRGVRAAPLTVTVYTLHRGDLTDARTPLQGEIADCRDEGPSCILTLAGKGARLERKLPVLSTGRDCSNTLYLNRCHAFEPAFAYTGGEVTALETTADGVVVTVDGAAAFPRPAADPDPDSYFERGKLTTPDGFALTIEAVDPDDGDRLTVPFAPPGLELGAIVTLSAGCPRIPTVCHGRFDRLEDFMGEPTIPIRNPFDVAGLVVG